ncbi:COG4648 family protein [Pectobacterium carotovorum]|uniref:COG4648 family protein n=1 Tax=Pectobacterium carotovorum TaxID=554 RepID=UPI00389AE0B8
MMRVLIRSLNILMTLAWPFLAWFSITHPEHRWLLAVLALMFVLRFATLRDENNLFKGTALWLAAAGVVLSVASLLLRDGGWLLWYPVAVNSVMLMLFGGSLYSGMPLVERLARLREPELPVQAISYTRRVTKVWCLFFIVNGSIAVLTCLVGNLHWWTLWNGVISYVLMGLLMGGEWLIRQRLRKRV